MRPWLPALSVFVLAACAPGTQTSSHKTLPQSAAREALRELEIPATFPGSTDAKALAALKPELAFYQAYEQAESAYVARQYLYAARRFLDAAQPILLPLDSYNGDLMAENRLICYKNAQLAFRHAAAGEEARAKLTAAAARDPHHAPAIAKLISGL